MAGKEKDRDKKDGNNEYGDEEDGNDKDGGKGDGGEELRANWAAKRRAVIGLLQERCKVDGDEQTRGEDSEGETARRRW